MAFSITDLIIILIILTFTVIGFVRGIFSKLLGLISFVSALIIAYYIASPISSLLVGTSFYNSIVGSIGSSWAGTIFLIVIGLICFIIIYIVLRILSKTIILAINKGKILGAINKLIGGVFGLIIGIFIATIYLLIFYGLAKVDPGIGAFYVEDLAINSNDFTLSKLMLKSIMNLFGSI